MMSEMAWYIPVLIFVARICDVSIGTVRLIMMMSGKRVTSAILGFFEVVIWVLAVGGVLQFLTHPLALIAYGLGFSAGVYVGMMIEHKLALGYRMVRVINPGAEADLATLLRERGYRVTRVDGRGRSGPVEVAFMVVRRRAVESLRKLIEEIAPQAFITIERVERAGGGSLPDGPFISRRPWGFQGLMRK
ncbi:MAG: DUF2179 domain-containing protein [Phycisphaerales bacterium]|nr:MAG: DUF2179 domain-containing protein [Phycisphaerales bacterium]